MEKIKCPKCEGCGEVEYSTIAKSYTMKCNHCNGTGYVEKNMLRVTACGVTADLRPNVVVADFEQGLTYSLWYHTTFNKVDDALEHLKDLYRDGINPDDIGIFWLNFDELREVKK
jgi:RecJ-like exonuclease